MITKKNRIFNGMLFPAGLLLLFCLSCVTPVKKDVQDYDNHVMAENSTMKKRLPLVERENDILTQENQQQKVKIEELEASVKALNAQLDDQKKLYADDMAAAQAQIVSLNEARVNLENEKNAQIEALNAAGATLKASAAQKEKALYARIVDQKATFDKERLQLAQAHAKKESDLSAQLVVLKKSLDNKKLEVTSCKMAMNEISSKLSEAAGRAESYKKERDQLSSRLQTATAAGVELDHKLSMAVKERERLAADLQAATTAVADLNRKLGAVVEERDQVAAELKAVTAANSELNRKLSALSSAKPVETPLQNR